LHPANDWQVAWAPDSQSIAFASDRNGASSIYRKATDGAAGEELLLRMPEGGVFPKDWSADGRFLTFSLDTASASTDIWALPFFGDRKPIPLVETNFSENEAMLSPDGQWIVYQSNESGALEIYIKPFARPGKLRISTGGGSLPRWRHDGRELFYMTPNGELMAVASKGGEALSLAAPSRLFRACGDVSPGTLVTPSGRATYDVTADGARFLMACRGPDATPSSVTVSVHWTEMLKP
jgi:Tol biopolymer transport system component